MIEISFLSVVRNEERYIKTLIDSIRGFESDSFKYELVIVNDGSTDRTREIVEKESQLSDFVRLVDNPGVGKVRGTLFGISLCKYDWLKFVDGDDYLDLSCIQLNHFEGDVLIHDYISFRNESKKRYNCNIRNQQRFLERGRSLPKGMFFCKRDLLLRAFPAPENMLFEDFWINFVCLFGTKVNYLNEPLYFYRQHEDNYYGDSSNISREKLKRMAERYLDTVPKIQERYNFQYDPYLIDYAEALMSPAPARFAKLIASPYYFLKLIYYFLLSR